MSSRELTEHYLARIEKLDGDLGAFIIPIQAVVQDIPLRAKEAGWLVLPVWVAWNPMVTEAFGAITALWVASRAVIWPDDGE